MVAEADDNRRMSRLRGVSVAQTLLEMVTMKLSLRALGALLGAVLLSGTVMAQDGSTLGEREKAGYMLGQDAARSLGPGLQDLDMATFQQAVETAMAGGKPALSAEDAKQVAQACAQRGGLRLRTGDVGQLGSQRGHGAGGDIEQVQAHPGLAPHAGDELHRQQRMAADIEEVVAWPYTFHTDEFAPDGGQIALAWILDMGCRAGICR